MPRSHFTDATTPAPPTILRRCCARRQPMPGLRGARASERLPAAVQMAILLSTMPQYGINLWMMATTVALTCFNTDLKELLKGGTGGVPAVLPHQVPVLKLSPGAQTQDTSQVILYERVS